MQKNDKIKKILEFLIDNQRNKAFVQIGKQKFEQTKVSVEFKNDKYFLIFEDPGIIHLLDEKKEYEVNFNYFELSEFSLRLCTAYGGNHIEIEWLS